MREWKLKLKLKTLPETKGSLLEDRLTSYIEKQVGWEPDYSTGPLRLIYANTDWQECF